MTDLTSERLAELRRIAEAATPGTWAFPHQKDPYGCYLLPLSENNASYIAAFDPTTALELLDRVEELSLACVAALRVLVAAGLFGQDEDGNITADTRFYDDLCKLANAARYVADYATDGLVAESEACLRHQFDAARAEAERWRKKYEALRENMQLATEQFAEAAQLARRTHRERGDIAALYRSDAWEAASQRVRRLLDEAGGGENG